MHIVNEWELLFASIVETGRKLGIAALLMLLFVVVMSTQALAAPKANGPNECSNFWDLALVARALAVTGHNKKQTMEVVVLVYNLNAEDKDPTEHRRIVEITSAIVSAAQASRDTTAEFAGKLRKACMLYRGDMDSVLGVGT